MQVLRLHQESGCTGAPHGLERQEAAACFNEALYRRLCAQEGRGKRKSMLAKYLSWVSLLNCLNIVVRCVQE